MRALAGEMSTLLLDGQNTVPRAALAAGYVFRFAQLEGALKDLARSPGAQVEPVPAQASINRPAALPGRYLGDR